MSYGAPPGAYGQRPPGVGPPPGMQSHSPGGMQHAAQGFQPPPNMPTNINFNASVIRMGVQTQDAGGRGSNTEPIGRRDRLGLGASSSGGGDGGRSLERERAAVRESMMALQPPTREEVARTIFVGGLSEGVPADDAIEGLLRCAGKLRRWTRARDADDRKCKFGFAEYEDVESLEAANEIFADGVEVPVVSKNGAALRSDEGDIKMARLIVVVDEQSRNYISEWKSKRKEDDDARQFRIDGCREDLRQALTSLTNSAAYQANAEPGHNDFDGDANMDNAQNGDGGDEVVNIPLNLEDELSDIPPEMRATVADEIRAFRDRSNRRDLERMRREEEIEQAEKHRNTGGRVNRLASPPPSSAPSGPASAANGIPVGPRGAPAGPKGFRGVQVPSDYVNGVNFVGANGAAVNREDEDAEESDEELERRRQAKKDAERQKQYLDTERRLQNRERTRAAAQERERVREDAQKREKEREKEAIAKRLREWDDEEEERLGREEYYYDRSSWLRKRGTYRDRELREDERDRAQEDREKAEERRKTAEARGLADDFLDQTSMEIERKAETAAAAAAVAAAAEPQGAVSGGFKMNLGSAAARTRNAAEVKQPKRAMAEVVEGLLEDEEDAAASGLKRPELKPLTETTSNTAPSELTDEERASLRQQLASDIPTSTDDLFAYPVKFNYLTPSIVDTQIRPFVEKKVVEYLGVQEDLLVDTVVDSLMREKEGGGESKGPRGVVAELEDALEEEAEVLVRKVWRLLVFWTECESRGLA